MTPNTIPVASPIQFMNAMISTGCWRNSVRVVITSAEWWTLWNSHSAGIL